MNSATDKLGTIPLLLIHFAENLKALLKLTDLKDPKRRKDGKKLLSLLSSEQRKELKYLKKLSKELKNARYAVEKNPENRTDSQNEKLKLIEVSSPELYNAYRMKYDRCRLCCK